MRCLICGDNKTKLLYVLDSRIGKKMYVVKCVCCGFIYQDPQPSSKDIVAMYPASLHESKRVSKLRFLKVYFERVRLKHVLREVHIAENILDVGCSNGFFLQLAKQCGFNIYGTEIGKMQIDYLKRHVTPNIFASEKDLIGKVKFDVITAFDVIEHLPDPELFIRNCSKLLGDDGVLVIMTFDANAWTYRYFKDRVSWLGDQHLFYFTADDLRILLGRYGLEIYKKEIYNKSFWHLLQGLFYLVRHKKVSFLDEYTFYIRKKVVTDK